MDNIKIKKSLNKKQAFTLIESLIVISLFAIILVTFYNVFTVGTSYIIDSKNRLSATTLANEKMEVLRNMDFNDLGTTTGIPQGDIQEREVVMNNSRTYYVFTFVQFIDDPYDGVLDGSPNDSIPTDYKRVRVKVAWEDNINSAKSVSVVSHVSRRGIETAEGGGTLSVNVLDTQGIGIPQATVNISYPAHGINITTQTNSSGNITLPGADAGTKKYNISVSKDGYYSVATHPPFPTSTYNPVDQPASVVANDLNVFAIETDRLSNATVHSLNAFGQTITNIGYTLTGGRRVGYTVVAPISPVYEYTALLNTGSSGTNEINNLSYGLYTFTPSLSSQYEFYKLVPADGDKKNVFDLPANTNYHMDAVMVEKIYNSLLLTVIRSDDLSALEGATATLTKDDASYTTTRTTGLYGMIYFPEALPELVSGNYTLTVSAPGFQDHSESFNITHLITKTVQLVPTP